MVNLGEFLTKVDIVIILNIDQLIQQHLPWLKNQEGQIINCRFRLTDTSIKTKETIEF